MLRYLRKRAISSIIPLFFVVFGVFVLVRLTGDPAFLYLAPNATQADRAAFDARNGFDKPILTQFWHYLDNVVHLNFGRSILTGQSAVSEVFRALPYTLQLAGLTLIVVLTLSIIFGCYAAYRPNSVSDRVLSFIVVATGSIPDFWFALMAIIIFSLKLEWLPTSGSSPASAWVLPVATLFVRPFSVLVQIIRNSMITALASPYVKVARSKGASELRIVLGHALRNAAPPALTVAGDLAIGLMNGVVVVETIFGWPGIGNLMITAIEQRDFVVVQTAVVVIAIMIFALNMLIDLGYGLLDPRVRRVGSL